MADSTDLKIRTLLESVGALNERLDGMVTSRQDSVAKKDDAGEPQTGQLEALLTKLLAHLERQDDDRRKHRAADDDEREREQEEREEGGEPREMSSDDNRTDAPDDTHGAPHFDGNREHAGMVDRHHRRDARADSLAAERENRLGELQQRWARCAAYWGRSVEPPRMEDSPARYDRRMGMRFQQHSRTHRFTDLAHVPDRILAHITDVIHQEAEQEAHNADSVAPQTLRMVTRHDQAGRAIHEFVGHPSAWMDQFRQGRSFRVRGGMKALQDKCEKIEQNRAMLEAMRGRG
jgi:hypothetical protein